MRAAATIATWNVQAGTAWSAWARARAVARRSAAAFASAFAGLVERPVRIARRFVVLLAARLHGLELLRQARRQLRDRRVQLGHHADLAFVGRFDGRFEDGR